MPQRSKPQQKAESTQASDRNHLAVLFDLDGTLADSNYEHVMAWAASFQKHKIEVEAWRIHRYIGISGKLLLRGIFREVGKNVSEAQMKKLEQSRKREFDKMLRSIRLLPGARELLAHLTKHRVRWAIASSGDKKPVELLAKKLRVPEGVPVITGEHVEQAKPEPDVFLEAARGLGVALENCIVVGDSVWDLLAARRARALGVGLLGGGYGREELERAGAYRVYANPADLLSHLEEIGIITVGD